MEDTVAESAPPGAGTAEGGIDGVVESAPRRAGTAASAAAGVASAAAALAAGELVCALAGSTPSLVSAVGTEFIDRFAGSLKNLAVSLFGTNDKPALVVGIVVASLVLGGVSGVLAARRFWWGAAGFAMFGAVGLWAYGRDPQAATGTGIVAALLAVATGLGCLALLLWLCTRPAGRGRAASGTVQVAPGAAGSPTPAPGPAERPPDPRTPSRRAFLVTTALVGTGALATAALARRVRASGRAETARQGIALPDASAARPVPAVQPFTTPGLSPYITPNADFFRIDTALVLPQVDVDSWRLDVTGMVDRPFTLSLDDLLAMPAVEETVTLQCVSNEVGGDLVGNAVWQGVPLSMLLERAGVATGATQVVGRSVDGWTAGFPTDLALDGRVALVAYAMGGEPLPVRHGFPARLLVAGLYGYVSATKWLREIELTTWEDFDGFWVPRGWAKDGPIKTMSRIDVPRSGAEVPAGPVAVAGVAWAPTRGIERVEVQVDDGSWRACRLGDASSENTWVQWLFEWEAPPGDHRVRVRATDGTGTTQTEHESRPDPDGATGWHTLSVRVLAEA